MEKQWKEWMPVAGPKYEMLKENMTHSTPHTPPHTQLHSVASIDRYFDFYQEKSKSGSRMKSFLIFTRF